MRRKLRLLYENHPGLIFFIYVFLKCALIFFKRYTGFKQEAVEAIQNFEPDLQGGAYRKQYRKLIVYRYIYYLRSNEYYLYGFGDVPQEERYTFMTRKLTYRYYKMINTKKYRKLLDRKNLSYEVLGKYYKRDLACIKGEEDLEVFEDFTDKHSKFILKPLSGHSGDGIEIIDSTEFESQEELFAHTLEKAPYVVEELIAQDEGVGRFHPDSVNTVRVVTFSYKEDFSILWAFLRTGQGASKVDNMGAQGAGGLGALIDHDTGIIVSDGVDWKGDRIAAHPDSGVVFKGYQIPRWNELLEMVKELASEIPELHCIGWDLSLTKDGWVLVEGNGRPQCVTIQTFTKKGYRPVYDKMYKLVAAYKKEQNYLFKGTDILQEIYDEKDDDYVRDEAELESEDLRDIRWLGSESEDDDDL